MGEEQENPKQQASLEHITTSDAFAALLEQEPAPLTVLVESWKGIVLHEALPPGDIRALFERLHAEMPRDLLFRAYREEVELAWLGRVGIAVRLGSGEDEAVPVVYRGERRVGKLEEPWCVTVHEIRRSGWVIYRKLRSALPVERA
jgi:hypothetical protein